MIEYVLGTACMAIYLIGVWVGVTIPVKCFSRCCVFPGIGFGPKSGYGCHDFIILRG